MSLFKDLNVWKLSFELVKGVYKLTKTLPKSEVFGLSSQLQRCAISIPSNLAEGQQRRSTLEFIQFIAIARGSAAELYTQLLLCKDIYNIDTGELVRKTEDVQKMLYALQFKLRK